MLIQLTSNNVNLKKCLITQNFGDSILHVKSLHMFGCYVQLYNCSFKNNSVVSLQNVQLFGWVALVRPRMGNSPTDPERLKALRRSVGELPIRGLITFTVFVNLLNSDQKYVE